MNNPPEEPLYVGFEDSSVLRRSLLEAAKIAVSSQKAFESLQAIQDKKLATRASLTKTLKELRDELSKLQMILPHRDVKEPAPIPVSPTPAVAAPDTKKKVAESKVDKIEAALAEIEQRMRSL